MTTPPRPLALLACALVLAGCGSFQRGVDAGVGRTASTSTPVPTLVNRPDAAHKAAFVTAFRKAYPQLAAGRPVKAIADDADSTCAELVPQPATGNTPVEVGAVTKHVIGRFERSDQKVSTAQAVAITSLVKRTACP